MKTAKQNRTLLNDVPANTIVCIKGRWGVAEGAPGRGKSRIVDFWWDGRERVSSDVLVRMTR